MSSLGTEKKYAGLERHRACHAQLLVVLDGVEDPHNLGAVIRTSHAAGADAVIIAERRAAGLTETVAKAAAGALEYLPVVQVVNINQTLRSLKDDGYFIYGLDEKGDLSYDTVDWPKRTVIVMGAEGKGLHDLVKRNCDALVHIPMAGEMTSLERFRRDRDRPLRAWRSRRDQKS